MHITRTVSEQLAQAVTPLTCIREELVSNLGWDTDDSEEDCSLFFSAHPTPRIVPE
jgi:hypothetical protein